jgi:hypothetical protein
VSSGAAEEKRIVFVYTAAVTGIAPGRWPLAIALVLLLAFTLSWLQGRFDSSDAKKAIAAAMSWKPAGQRTVFDGLAAKGEGDPQCVGKVVSQLLGDVQVLCSTPQKPQVEYEFRVLLDGRRPPRPANSAAESLIAGLR